MECIGSVECTQFVFPVSILISPGMCCETSDGELIVSLIGSGLFLLNPALPCPMHSFSTLSFMGLACCFSGFMLGSKFFPCHELLEV